MCDWASRRHLVSLHWIFHCRIFEIAISEQNEIAIIRQIDLHAEIIEWYQIVNKIISAILVSRLSTAAVVICVLGFELSVVGWSLVEFLNQLKILKNSRQPTHQRVSATV